MRRAMVSDSPPLERLAPPPLEETPRGPCCPQCHSLYYSGTQITAGLCFVCSQQWRQSLGLPYDKRVPVPVHVKKCYEKWTASRIALNRQIP